MIVCVLFFKMIVHIKKKNVSFRSTLRIGEKGCVFLAKRKALVSCPLRKKKNKKRNGKRRRGHSASVHHPRARCALGVTFCRVGTHTVRHTHKKSRPHNSHPAVMETTIYAGRLLKKEQLKETLPHVFKYGMCR